MTLRFFSRFLVFVCTFLGLSSGCAQSASIVAPHKTTIAGAQASYRLAPGDALTVRFFYNPELNESVQIRPDGRISLGLIGELHIDGLTIVELTASLEALYQDTLRRPAITIQVTSYANQKFFVGGEVQRPGMFLLTGQQTVLGAILEAGGMTKTAERNNVYLIRRTNTADATTMKISLDEFPDQPSSAAALRIEPYDVIVVAESGVARANRFVDQYIRQMLPVLLSGGFTYLLNSNGDASAR